MIPVSKIVNVQILRSPTFPARRGFGLLNIVGSSARLPIGERIRFYADMDGVAEDFSSLDEEYKAANIYFSQSPKPVELAISRRFSSAVPGELIAALGYEKDITGVWNAITDGGFDVAIDGVLKQVSAIDFSLATNMPAIANAIQVALQSVAAGATVVHDGSRFIIKSGSTGTTSTVGFLSAPTHASIPTDISALMAGRVSDLGRITAGAAEETITDSLDAIQDISQAWYGLAFTKEVTEAGLKEAAAWSQARVKIFGFTTNASNVLDPLSTADICSFMKANLYDRTFYTWDDNDDYQFVSAFGRAFTVNFNEQNSTITLKFKLLPSTTPIVITESQRKTLIAKNCNYYTYFGDSAMLAEGVMADGTFFDERHGLDWFQNAIETNVFGYLYTRPTKVPQTDKGMAALVQQVEKAGHEAVNNGLLAPGFWEGMDLGEVTSGDFLPKGFYVYAQKVKDQNRSDREARIATPIQMLAKGAGAIHFANISVTFER